MANFRRSDGVIDPYFVNERLRGIEMWIGNSIDGQDIVENKVKGQLYKNQNRILIY